MLLLFHRLLFVNHISFSFQVFYIKGYRADDMLPYSSPVKTGPEVEWFLCVGTIHQEKYKSDPGLVYVCDTGTFWFKW